MDDTLTDVSDEIPSDGLFARLIASAQPSPHQKLRPNLPFPRLAEPFVTPLADSPPPTMVEDSADDTGVNPRMTAETQEESAVPPTQPLSLPIPLRSPSLGSAAEAMSDEVLQSSVTPVSPPVLPIRLTQPHSLIPSPIVSIDEQTAEVAQLQASPQRQEISPAPMERGSDSTAMPSPPRTARLPLEVSAVPVVERFFVEEERLPMDTTIAAPAIRPALASVPDFPFAPSIEPTALPITAPTVPPPIRIHIGRVEIRAIAPPEPRRESRRETAQERAKGALEKYLDSENRRGTGGAR